MRATARDTRMGVHTVPLRLTEKQAIEKGYIAAPPTPIAATIDGPPPIRYYGLPVTHEYPQSFKYFVVFMSGIAVGLISAILVAP